MVIKKMKQIFNLISPFSGPYYGQYKQDKYLYKHFFRHKNDGFFVEVGADDGVDKSNTLFFENKGWEGICIEASPTRYPLLLTNRKCHCVNALIANGETTYKFNDYAGWGKGLSGIRDFYDPKHVDRIELEKKHKAHKGGVTFDLPSIRLAKVFKNFNVKEVDLCSIDVEGAELEVLKSIDFSDVKIHIFIIENNYQTSEVYQYLVEQGYSLYEKLTIDDVYVRNDVLSERLFR